MSSHQPKVAILLATYNGAEFLEAQLESFREQTYSNWDLFVSDDASTDATVQIIESFSKSVPQRVKLLRGPQEGFWHNFVSLVRSDEAQGDLFAYSDQDDIWFAEKIARAVDWFSTQSVSTPAVYCTRTELWYGDGRPVGYSPLFTRSPTFRNALVQNIGGGNTMVFNSSARQALLATPKDAELVSHDWWTYQVVTGVGGVAHYDPWPSLRYRQHGRNLSGANTGWRALLARLQAFARGRVALWNDINLRLLGQMRGVLTAENAAVVDNYSKARQSSLPMRLWLVWKSGVYRHSIIEYAGILIGSLFKKI